MVKKTTKKASKACSHEELCKTSFAKVKADNRTVLKGLGALYLLTAAGFGLIAYQLING